MNDESSVVEATEASPCQTCDTSAMENAPEGIACDTPLTEETPPRRDEAVAGIFADSGTNSDIDCKNSNSETQESELEQLRSELKQLKEEIAERDARTKQDSRIEREYAEFCDLFPNVPVGTLPEEIWQDVKNGTSLAAAYALAEKKHAIALERAKSSNASNRARSAGAIQNAQNDEYSPAEVRAMTSSEVRANLSKIMRSMQKWH